MSETTFIPHIVIVALGLGTALFASTFAAGVVLAKRWECTNWRDCLRVAFIVAGMGCGIMAFVCYRFPFAVGGSALLGESGEHFTLHTRPTYREVSESTWLWVLLIEIMSQALLVWFVISVAAVFGLAYVNRRTVRNRSWIESVFDVDVRVLVARINSNATIVIAELKELLRMAPESAAASAAACFVSPELRDSNDVLRSLAKVMAQGWGSNDWDYNMRYLWDNGSRLVRKRIAHCVSDVRAVSTNLALELVASSKLTDDVERQIIIEGLLATAEQRGIRGQVLQLLDEIPPDEGIDSGNSD